MFKSFLGFYSPPLGASFLAKPKPDTPLLAAGLFITRRIAFPTNKRNTSSQIVAYLGKVNGCFLVYISLGGNCVTAALYKLLGFVSFMSFFRKFFLFYGGFARTGRL